MKRVLYISNIEVPYRVRFFNELAKHCCLTVLYESRGSKKRNRTWAKSEEKQFRACYYAVDLPKLLGQTFDAVILGCYQTPLQILTAGFLRLRRIPYILNLDGEPFLEGSSLKARCKRWLLSGGSAYLAAGELAAKSLQAVAGNKKIIPYYFSSLLQQETDRTPVCGEKENSILVVGQYYPYKGLDVALKAAEMDTSLAWRFVGMGTRTEKFLRENRIPKNVQVIPFLQKEALYEQYRRCRLLVLPSRRECWGLVINEAASFGLRVVSTWGSGAAVEFLSEDYPEYLAKPGDAEDLLRCIRRCLSAPDPEGYGASLRRKGQGYSIETSVAAHLQVLEETQ